MENAQIDNEEEDIGVNEYPDDCEVSEEDEEEMESEQLQRAENNGASIFSGKKDNAANESSLETNHNVASNLAVRELVDDHPTDNAYEVSAGDLEAVDNQDNDYSDGWLASEDDQNPWSDEDGASIPSKSMDDHQSESLKDWRMEKSLHSYDQSGPHVKTSALMGVGLQELLELIDWRLKDQEKELKAQNVVERSIFDRKWRPPRKEEAGVAVEQ